MSRWLIMRLAWVSAIVGAVVLGGASAGGAETGLVQKTWTIDGVQRRAMVFVPAGATKQDTPVIFAFHGHGGTMQHAARTFALEKYWPEALVVYMQGLPTASMTDREGKLPGWQMRTGVENDRDLKFFDQVLATLKQDYRIDAKRIFATGHSNGGGFTYLLWMARGDTLAAVAPSGAAMLGFRSLKPKPVLHLAGEKDEIVKFEWQSRTMQAVRRLNHCDEKGEPWAKAGTLAGTIYPSRSGTPFVSLIYPGGHQFPSEAPALIVRFFKQCTEK